MAGWRSPARTLQVIIRQEGADVLRGHAGKGQLVPIEPPEVHATRQHEHTFESEVGFEVFDIGGQLVMATTNLATLPAPRLGDAEFRDIRANGYRWRLFTLQDPSDGVVIRTGERYDSRHDILRALWFRPRAAAADRLAAAGPAGGLGGAARTAPAAVADQRAGLARAG
ncbi:sensor histidine kinase N-terminal domain-containing protein [Rhodanobacter lindaniclasticus]